MRCTIARLGVGEGLRRDEKFESRRMWRYTDSTPEPMGGQSRKLLAMAEEKEQMSPAASCPATITLTFEESSPGFSARL